ncbi:glycoside hydrolase family 65 protein [Paractinoplanes brasiliensis]|uniref:Alpha,alpha-trehalose phosphorylase n=1 Tax=Paractinoplanes brasiliensis TaxID=52695 RepID=A0A4V3C8F1_9ACTN|nr:glycosyl hydrolase family 65 protein [Actinoplanes brasiliensis]TDO40918.1 alpha,alpha-trehalose phosphorylase [Actinoplanes brasiliensis]GID25987.1 glycosyl hydrolase [Actinoplanes brasiliensis]
MSRIAPAEPWVVREIGLPEGEGAMRQAESLFALANGHIGLRGNLDEPEPRGMPGTYLNSLFEERDLTYPEAGFAFPERTETIVNAPNGKPITLTVGGEPFDVRTGELRRHERVLDLRAGTLTREVEWVSPRGVEMRLRSVRVVSFQRPSVAAIRYSVEADAELRVDSDLVVNEEQPPADDDPRASAVIRDPFEPVFHDRDLLVHRTRRSGITVAVAVTHVGADGELVTGPDRIRWTATAPGSITFDKIFAYGWDGLDQRDNARAERDAAARAGFDELLAEQRQYLDDFWAYADVEMDGDDQVQQGTRFGLFHVLQAGAQAGPHPIPSKGLTGNGYDGHTLWDNESYVLPVLTYTHPACVGQALRWRHSTLDHARERARELKLDGAAFPWRTISGPECSGYWPAGTAALHINADIADAVLRYHAATGDDEFMREAGDELIAETARLWRKVSYFDEEGVAHIAGVTGPDEYTALMDDNVFTNLMARRNLRAAALDEVSEHIADRLAVPYDERRGVHEQAAGFTRLDEWKSFAGEDYPLMLHHHYLNLYRKQVVKQADLVLAMAMCGDEFTPEEKRRNFEYYEARTVRDSSLSAPVQAVLAAELGHLSLAYAYLTEAALLDLRAGGESGGDGLHIAACAGSWIAVVMGFGGLRDTGGTLSLSPRIPPRLTRLQFRLRWRGTGLRVTVTPETVTYQADGPISFQHYGEDVTLNDGEVSFKLDPIEDLPAPPTPRPPGEVE